MVDLSLKELVKTQEIINRKFMGWRTAVAVSKILAGQLMRGLNGLAGFDGQLIEPHGTAKEVSTTTGPTSCGARRPGRPR